MLKIVFFGTPNICVNSLDFLAKCDDVQVCAVITKVDKPQGRGQKLLAPPIKQKALELNLEVLQPKLLRKDDIIIQKLKSYEPDFFVTFAYGQILSKEILDIPKCGTINLHASLLPKYRGANPIQCAIVNGETKTGITTMLTVEELDAGDICQTIEIEITPNMNDDELSDVISKMSPELIYQTMKDIINKKICPIEQNHSCATFTCKFSKEDGAIDWNKGAIELHNKIRGLCSWPCCYSFMNNKMIKIIQSNLSSEKTDTPAGTFIGKNKEGLNFSVGNGEVLTIVKVKPEGKKEMRALDWLNGAKLKIGDKFQ